MGEVERKIVSEESLTIYYVRGTVSRGDVVEAIEDFYEKGPVTKNVLWDLSQADLQDIKAHDVQLIANVPRRVLELREGGKTAIVAHEDLAYGLSRMYQVTTGSAELPYELQVFRDIDAARSWIDENRTE